MNEDIVVQDVKIEDEAEREAETENVGRERKWEELEVLLTEFEDDSIPAEHFP
jgi:hypothetical protein